MTRSRARSSRRRALAGAAFALVSVGAGLGYASSVGRLELPSLAQTLRRPELQLRRVEFVGLIHLDADELWRLASVPSRTPLVDVDARAVAERIGQHPRVERAQVLRVPPGHLLIGVSERVPVAVDPTGFGVDARGARFPLLPDEREGLPRLVGSFRAGLPLLRAARELGVRVGSVRARSPRDLRFEPRGAQVEVRVGRDVRASLRTWLRVRASGLVDEYGASEVDLRFGGSAVLRGLRKRGG